MLHSLLNGIGMENLSTFKKRNVIQYVVGDLIVLCTNLSAIDMNESNQQDRYLFS